MTLVFMNMYFRPSTFKMNVFERHLLEDSNITRFHLSWLLMLSVAAPFDFYHVIVHVKTLKAFNRKKGDLIL